MNDMDGLQSSWREAWPVALACWSRYTRLSEPRWCHTASDRKREQVEGTIAMIRLSDHAVVINLREIQGQHLEEFAREILAHEIGHHVLVPGDLRDNALLLWRIRTGLPGDERHAPFIANLWADLLINDRLQRRDELDMAGVYRALSVAGSNGGDRLWRLYLRIYERLWRLPRGDLGSGEEDQQIDFDADLGARTVRIYARDWLVGGSRFACLLQPYVAEREEASTRARVWLDAIRAGADDTLPEGLAGYDGGIGDAIHPAEDPRVAGLGDRADGEGRAPDIEHQLSPADYIDVLRATGVEISEIDLVIRFYRELALPHLVRFPSLELPAATDPLPEGLETWDVGASLEGIDWVESAARGGVVIPGVTTLERSWGISPVPDPERQPLDLYVGIDCSGSMADPARTLSYPVLAGAIVTLSALRHKASVRACLSGETPGEFVDSGGFSRDERQAMSVLCAYLGTGYSFGIERLRQAFLTGAVERPTHLMLISDADWFRMLERGATDGWEVAQRAVEIAGGGATAVLHLSGGRHQAEIERLESIGWSVHLVTSEEELVGFARAFSRRTWPEWVLR